MRQGSPLPVRRLLRRVDAATYLGVSPSLLDELEIPARRLRSIRLYDLRDLDAFASALPYAGEDPEENPCDSIEAFA